MLTDSFGCITAVNELTGTPVCSDFELFFNQMTKRAITMDIQGGDVYKNSPMLKKEDTIKSWGLDIFYPPEYNYFQE